MTLEELLEIRMEKTAKVKWIADRPKEYPNLIATALSNTQPMGWRAAWLLRDTMAKADKRVIPYTDKILAVLPALPEGHQRELLKCVEVLPLDDEQEGQLFDLCVGIWERIGKQPSIRSVALKLLVQIAKKYPELVGELDHLGADEYMEPLSPGIRRSCERMFDDLRKLRK